jgi:hypothetical protein
MYPNRLWWRPSCSIKRPCLFRTVPEIAETDIAARCGSQGHCLFPTHYFQFECIRVFISRLLLTTLDKVQRTQLYRLQAPAAFEVGRLLRITGLDADSELSMKFQLIMRTEHRFHHCIRARKEGLSRNICCQTVIEILTAGIDDRSRLCKQSRALREMNDLILKLFFFCIFYICKDGAISYFVSPLFLHIHNLEITSNKPLQTCTWQRKSREECVENWNLSQRLGGCTASAGIKKMDES